MEKIVYNQIKSFSFRSEFYSREISLDEIASWAIWNPSDLNDTIIIENSIKKLQSNKIFIALNFAGSGDFDFENLDWTSWKNFHSNSKMDTRIFNVLKNTKYEGAYMTDIIKCVPTKDANDLKQMIKNGKIDMNAQTKIFIDEINILNNDKLEMYLMGYDTEKIFEKFIYEKIKNKIQKLKRILHPSPNGIRNNTTFYEQIRSQLGINNT
jgi:hypothetical protein